jgi:ketosteroid isomerase-like protein
MRVVIAVIGLVFLLCGCGAEAERAAAPKKPEMSADERAIRDTLKRYVDATRANDPKGVCAVTAREVIDQIEALGATCESFVAEPTRKGGPNYSITTTSVVVTGDRAMTRGKAVESDGPRSGDQPLVRENGRWLLTTKAG